MVARHALRLDPGEPGRIPHRSDGAPDGIDERSRLCRTEDEAGAVLGVLVGVDDGVGEATAVTHHRRGGVAHGDDLALPAGLEARRHEEQVGSGVDPARLVAIEALQHRDPVGMSA